MNSDLVRSYLVGLQERICTAIEAEDGGQVFIVDEWNREEGGGGRSQVLTNGKIFEKAGVNFSLVTGENLPPTQVERR